MLAFLQTVTVALCAQKYLLLGVNSAALKTDGERQHGTLERQDSLEQSHPSALPLDRKTSDSKTSSQSFASKLKEKAQAAALIFAEKVLEVATEAFIALLQRGAGLPTSCKMTTKQDDTAEDSNYDASTPEFVTLPTFDEPIADADAETMAKYTAEDSNYDASTPEFATLPLSVEPVDDEHAKKVAMDLQAEAIAAVEGIGEDMPEISERGISALERLHRLAIWLNRPNPPKYSKRFETYWNQWWSQAFGEIRYDTRTAPQKLLVYTLGRRSNKILSRPEFELMEKGFNEKFEVKIEGVE